MESLETKSSYFACEPSRGLQWVDLAFRASHSPSRKKEEGAKSLPYPKKNLEKNFENPTKPEKGRGDQNWISLLDGYNPDGDFFGSGNFFLFPWVNRMHPNSYSENSGIVKDGNGYPLHGLVYDREWKLCSKTDNSMEFNLDFSAEQTREGKKTLNQARISTHFRLGEDSLGVEVAITNLSDHDWVASIGCHPYFRLPGNVDDWVLEFPVGTEEMILSETMLPVICNESNKILSQKIESNTICLENRQLDHLYHLPRPAKWILKHKLGGEGILFRDLVSDTSEKERIHLEYVQVYTPAHRNSIAIEPMSSPGNYENIPLQTKIILTKKNKKKLHFLIKFLLS